MRALITGASSGIGRDMAKELANKNYDLILVARNKEGLEDLQKNLKLKHPNIDIEIHSYDLSIKENCFELHEKAKDIDILINNAGFGLFGKFTNTDLEKEVNMINTNITALHVLTKLYLKDMVEKDRGKILNVASIAGFMPGPLMATYYASKNYVVALTRAINKELKKDKSNVKISLLCPGPVDTNFNNVADVKFKIKGLTSEFVAKYAVNKMLKGKLIIVPGFSVRSARRFIEILPDRITEIFAYNSQVRKESRK